MPHRKTFLVNRLLFGICVSLAATLVQGQSPPKPFGAVPTAAQLQWHEMEMYCLIHYGVDTYTDKEWGFGDESPALIQPVNFNAEQIVGAAKAGGFKGVIVVAKHHDGLCLWPTATTTHNISKSPWREGKGDMMKEYELACKKLGMKLGVYCSPWDRNSAVYGKPEYVRLYRDQLKELYSNYGPLFISWHDGANGGDGYYGGANERRNIDRSTYYGWDTTFSITRKLQPSAVIFGDIGPDVRWVGNEEGFAGATCWATFTPEAPDKGKMPSHGYSKYWLATEGTKNGKFWMPAECDVPLRPGWFYHATQDDQVKSPYTLLDLYYKSVGRGANLDLGLAPDQSGQLHTNDVNVLKEFGLLLQATFRKNLASGAVLTASNVRSNNVKKFGPSFLIDEDRYSYWATDDSVLRPQLVIDLKRPTNFNVIRLRENIRLGQRVSSVAIDVLKNSHWEEIAAATSIGSNRLIRLPQHITARKLRLRITGADACIALSDFGLFKERTYLTPPMIKRTIQGMVSISTLAPVAGIRYTVDGSEPGPQSPVYHQPFLLADGGIVKARSFEEGQQWSTITTVQFGLSKQGWKVENEQAKQAIDDNDQTFFRMNTATLPYDIVVDMGKQHKVWAFTYLPRQDRKADGIADKYVFSISVDGKTWKEAVAGEFSNIQSNPVQQFVQLDQAQVVRYFKFSVLRTVPGNGISIAELGVNIKKQ